MKRLLPVVAVAVLAAGCAETQFAAQTTKTLTKSDRPAVGHKPGGPAVGYKVGQPYQINGVWYYPKEDFGYAEVGVASWYGSKFHGRQTANGERYDMNELTAAHPTLPMPSLVRVTNLENGRSLKLRVNDRGPFVGGRVIDVSKRAAQLLGFQNQGTARVRVEILGEESRILAGLAPGDRGAVMASLRQDAASSPSSVSQLQFVAADSVAPPASRPKREQVTLASASADMLRPTVAPGDGTSARRPFVQAGAYSYVASAEQVGARLKPLGPVHITTVDRDGQEMYRVRVGPLASTGEADRLLARVVQAGFPNSRIVYE
ncbi:MAG: septal ring lytic transglycosylase RlpA family protein [Rhodospirillales bacterium]|nr:MAG: septal ring lytic transglycosylase RlpA family protein [Rhodospirillales bacterium]